jgi:hypothetical protein
MSRIRQLAAGLLCLTGIIHIGRLGMTDAPVVIVVGFGVAYSILGGLLFRNQPLAYYGGLIVPSVGLCVGPFVLPNPPMLLAAALGSVEITIVVCCALLLRNRWRTGTTPNGNEIRRA